MRRRRVVLALLVLIGFGIIGGLCLSCRTSFRDGVASAENIIRLHVVANSDNTADQALKLAVRDAVLAEMAPLFRPTADVAAARQIVRENLGRLEDIARHVVEQNGRTYPVTAALDNFAFPTRVYGALVLPAGDYEALRITLGTGQGRNWWCVLFPPLCFLEGTATKTGGAGETAVALVAEPDPSEIEIRSKLAELWQQSVRRWRERRQVAADATAVSPE